MRAGRPQYEGDSTVNVEVGLRVGYLYRPRTRHPVPVVVFSHGIASLHLQHVGRDRQLWSGNVFNLVGRLQAVAQEAEAIARARFSAVARHERER